MGRQLVLGLAVVVVVGDRWVDCWCRAGQSSSSLSTDGGRQMGRQLVSGLAVVVITVDRWVDCSQGPQNGGSHLGM
eukprot:3434552-Rhodomonas_salina.2